MIDDAGLIASPARIGEPNGLTFFVCEWLGVCDLAVLGIEICYAKRASRNLSLESLLELKTDFGLVD